MAWKFAGRMRIWGGGTNFSGELILYYRSKHGFDQYIVCYALERHGGVILEKVEPIFCGKGNFGGKWRMTVYNWLKVKLLYYSSIK